MLEHSKVNVWGMLNISRGKPEANFKLGIPLCGGVAIDAWTPFSKKLLTGKLVIVSRLPAAQLRTQCCQFIA